MTVTLYYQAVSPPCRANLVVLTLLKVPYKLKLIDLAKREQFQPEIIEMNPEHTIPILTDGDTVILDSHVINGYLVDKYAKNDEDRKLYPKDPIARANVDHKSHFDTGVLFQSYHRVKRAYVPDREITGVTPKIVAQFDDTYNAVEGFLKKSKYIAGNDVTIADISSYVSITTMMKIWPPNASKFPLTVAYLKRCETSIPHLKSINDPGVQDFEKIMTGFKTTL